MKRDALIDDHRRMQAKVPEHPSVRPSVHLEFSPLLILSGCTPFFHDFYVLC